MLDDMEAPPIEDTAGQTMTHLTITDFDATVIPKNSADKSKTIAQCKEALQQVAGQFSILDRKTGWMAWLKGKILLRAQDACGGENSKEWKQFREEIGMPTGMAQDQAVPGLPTELCNFDLPESNRFEDWRRL
jgi:hypothetical protein